MDTNTTEAFQLSPQQRQRWLANAADSPQNAQALLRLDGPVDAEALRLAARRVVVRHEVLRTTFKRMPGIRVPFQVVHAEGEVEWRHVVLAPADSAEESRLAALVNAELHRLSDRESRQNLRVCLIQVTPDRHALVLTMPALSADAITLENLAREIAAEYQNGGQPGADAPVLQYADFAAWENELLETDEAAGDPGRSFWQKEITASPASIRLPFETESDVPGPAVPSLSRIARTRPGSLTHSIPGASPAAVCLAAWQTLLWRLTGSTDPAVATAMPGRKVEETRQALGLFAKQIPIQCSCDPGMPFAELATTVEQKLRDADTWQEYFTGNDSADGDRTADRPIGFEFIDLPPSFESRETTWQLEDVDTGAGGDRLRLSVLRSGNRWTAKCEYDNTRFRRDDVERYVRYYQTLLESAVNDPSCPLGRLTLLDANDRRELLVGLNDTAAALPAVASVIDLFEQQVARTPDGLAAVSGENQLTYSSLDARANQLAHRLRRLGVAERTSIALCVDRSVEMLVGLLGILKAGGCYVPLNPEHPKARLKQQMIGASAAAIVTEEQWLDALPDLPAVVVCVDRDAEPLREESSVAPPRTIERDDLVYVLYTSGSTGTPKGVAVRHGNLLNYTSAICQRLELDGREADPLHFASVSTITADLGNTVIFPSLASGGCLHVMPYTIATDADAFARYVSAHPIDVLKIVPSHLKALLQAGTQGELMPRRTLVLGGEAFSWDLADELRRRPGHCRIFNHYGPTETTVGSLTFELGRETGQWRRTSRTVPIGRPLANTEVYILDDQAAPVPFGVSGELYIGGAGVAQGYIGQPELTRERFAAHPFAERGNSVLYKTGDVARYLPDGNIEFLGRRDQQIKLRGFRVELGEIEASLLAHPSISEAVVVLDEPPGGEPQLVAYVAGQEPSADELRRFVSETLPSYMLPSMYVVVGAMPLTRNGKIDRQALAALRRELDETKRTFVAPRTPLEADIANVWAEVLKRDRVGVHDDFFELGGHSLLVTQIVSRIRSHFHVELPLRAIFEHPTVAGIALVVDQLRASQDAAEEISPILAALEQLSEEDAARLLNAELGAADRAAAPRVDAAGG